MNQLTQLNQIQTMSSLEIAELTGKEHRNVTRDIETQLGKLDGGVSKFEHTHVNQQNKQEYKSYLLPKRETLILISGYSVELRAKIIDRWEQLENQSKPKTQVEIILAQAQALLDIERKQKEQDSRITQLENKIEKRLTDDIPLQLVLPSQLGKMFEPNLTAQKVNVKLREAGLQWRVGGEWVPTNEGRPYSSSEPVQVEAGKIVYQLKWQRKVKELLT